MTMVLTDRKCSVSITAALLASKDGCCFRLVQNCICDTSCFISLQSDPAAIFQSNFAAIKDSIAARLDKALGEFYTASLIPQVLYDDVMSMGGPNSGKAARVTQELQRKIRDSPNPSERLEEVCQILLKLEDEKLNRIVEDISERQDKYL